MTTIRLQVAPRVGPAYPRGSHLAVMLWLAVQRGLAAHGAVRPGRPCRSTTQRRRRKRCANWRCSTATPTRPSPPTCWPLPTATSGCTASSETAVGLSRRSVRTLRPARPAAHGRRG